MKFEKALVALHAGKKVRRAGWDAGTCIIKGQSGFIIWELPDGKWCNSIPFSTNDFLVEDWEVIGEEND